MPRTSSPLLVVALLLLCCTAAISADRPSEDQAPRGQLKQRERTVGKGASVNALGRLLKAENKDKFKETSDDAQVLLGEFIVTVADAAPAGDAERVSSALSAANGTTVDFVAGGAQPGGWRGFAFRAPAGSSPQALAALLDGMLADASVAHVTANTLLFEHDRMSARSLKQRNTKPAPPPSPSPAPAPPTTTACIPSTAIASTPRTAAAYNWGLDRIDGRANDAVTRATYAWQYRAATFGAGANIFMIDTGVLATHEQLAGRVTRFYDVQGADATDVNGHGTHKAAIAAGLTVGVAPAATIHAARVMDAAGNIDSATVIAALNAIVASPLTRKIASISLGGAVNAALNSAVDAAFRANVLVITSAGNSGADACTQSPASAPSALTVAASTLTDAAWPSTNVGTCVDLFAPGDKIYSAYKGGNNVYAEASGTSSSTPFVAGAAARLWAKGGCTSAADCSAKLLCSAGASLITGAIGTSPNLLLSVSPGV